MRMVLRKLWLPIAPKALMISPTLLLNYLLLKPMRFGWKMQLNLWNITLNASSSSPNSHTSNSSGISPSSSPLFPLFPPPLLFHSLSFNHFSIFPTFPSPFLDPSSSPPPFLFSFHSSISLRFTTSSPSFSLFYFLLLLAITIARAFKIYPFVSWK